MRPMEVARAPSAGTGDQSGGKATGRALVRSCPLRLWRVCRGFHGRARLRLPGPVVHPVTWLGAGAPSGAWRLAALEPPAAVAAALFAKPKAA